MSIKEDRNWKKIKKAIEKIKKEILKEAKKRKAKVANFEIYPLYPNDPWCCDFVAKLENDSELADAMYYILLDSPDIINETGFFLTNMKEYPAKYNWNNRIFAIEYSLVHFSVPAWRDHTLDMD